MLPSDLDFFTTQELIAELMRRKTFLGVVVQSSEEHKQADWIGDRIFTVHLNSNLTTEQASRLLETVATYMDQHC